MKLFVLALIVFLLAFIGLAIGLIFRRKGIRSSCGHAPDRDHDCHCEAELGPGMQGQAESCCNKDEN